MFVSAREFQDIYANLESKENKMAIKICLEMIKSLKQGGEGAAIEIKNEKKCQPIQFLHRLRMLGYTARIDGDYLYVGWL